MSDAGVETDEVTIVVMTRDRWPDLEKSLPRHRAPVILVDNGSRDGTPERVRERFPHVTVVELGDNRGAVARNIGVQRARTPYVAFADDDSWWAPGSLRKAAELFETHPRLGVVAGRMLIGPEEREDGICAEMAESPLGRDEDLPGPSVLGFLACGAVVRREAFLEAGGFDDVVFFMGEEERLALDLAAAGWGQAYAEDVVAHHHPSPVRDSVDRRARAARNRLLTALLRRPWPVVTRTAYALATEGRGGQRGIARALPAVPRALRARRPLPAAIESSRRLLDAPG
ncbi:glycosyltransferase family 2 protein [Nocardioides sp. SYSU DS0651]|uniref:glycosyltransferase family 2 protein n=1 Tax=Nocardioides sp. SYSU DS0651 TaxID=3415955 RepID=UPI003F4B04E8